MSIEKVYKKTGLGYGNANFNQIYNVNVKNYSQIACDICGSPDIIETREDYVCHSCGVVLEIPKLEYNKPYNNDKIQYAVLGTTQIGNIKERNRDSRSVKLNKLNRLHSIKSNAEMLIISAKVEISRIFNCLNLPASYKELVFKKFIKIYNALRPGTKYRTPNKLAPICIYYVLKFQNASVDEPSLLEVSNISKKDFNAFKLQIKNFFPQYLERNRKDYVLQKVFELSEYFELGMNFYYQAKNILYKLWEGIKNTKDDVIAGIVASISVLCSFKGKVSVNAICKKLAIRMSTIQSQVKKNIFDRFKISGFISLIQSSDILKQIMLKLGLVKAEKVIEEKIVPEIVKIKFNNVSQVSNHYIEGSFHFYAFLDTNNRLNTVFPYWCDKKILVQSPPSDVSNGPLNIMAIKHLNGKGPPD